MDHLLSFALTADAGMGYAFEHSDAMGKGIVAILFLGSIIAWSIMLIRGLALNRAKVLSDRFAEQFDQKKAMGAMLRASISNPCPIARVYTAGVAQLLQFYGSTAEEAIRNSGRLNAGNTQLTEAQLNAVQMALEREVSSQIFISENGLGVLGTAVSLSPFLGLFGTVWGVMIAFCGVASAGSANIQALAPGVAGALLTTVAGLIVAIPSLIGYNFLNLTVRKLTAGMDNFSEAFMAKLKLEQISVRNGIPAAAAQGSVPPAQPPLV